MFSNLVPLLTLAKYLSYHITNGNNLNIVSDFLLLHLICVVHNAHEYSFKIHCDFMCEVVLRCSGYICI